MKTFLFILFIAFGSSRDVYGQSILPADRLINWSLAGVSGGIPLRTIIYTNITSGASQNVISNALKYCPSNQVVHLAAGNYTISGASLIVPSYVTLRGDGSNTVLNLTVSGDYGFGVGLGNGSSSGYVSSGASHTPITAGYSKGSTNLYFANASLFGVGDLLLITSALEPFMTRYGEDNSGNHSPPWRGDCSYCNTLGADGGLPEHAIFGQIVVVTGKSGTGGTNVTISQPLHWNYKAALSPTAFPYSPVAKWAGLEDLTLNDAGSGLRVLAQINQAHSCWISNVWFLDPAGDFAWISVSANSEIDHCYMRGGQSHGPGTTDDAIKINYCASLNKIENNIVLQGHGSIMIDYGASGNVIAYNFCTNQWDSSSSTMLTPDQVIHDPHPMYNLWEGNIGGTFKQDSLFGSSSHSMLLRNWMVGTNWWAGTGQSTYAGAYIFDWAASTNTLIGNIAGCAGFAVGNTSIGVASNAISGHPEFQFGYDYAETTNATNAIAGFSRLLPWQSIMMHGNYSFVTSTQQWDGAISGQTLPNSFYLTSKPPWFGTNNWPPIDPAAATTMTLTALPAGYRFMYGADAGAAIPDAPRNLIVVGTVTVGTLIISPP
jgi:hypothetical protein